MSKVLVIYGNMGYAGTDFKQEIELHGDETNEELDEMAVQAVLDRIDYSWDVEERSDFNG